MFAKIQVTQKYNNSVAVRLPSPDEPLHLHTNCHGKKSKGVNNNNNNINNGSVLYKCLSKSCDSTTEAA